jgi:hypothetical protein
MRMLLSPTIGLSILALAATTSAQVQATFVPFGSGCPGTGIGIGENHVAPAAMATSYGAGNAIPFGWTPVVYQELISGSELPTAFVMKALSLRQPRSGPLSQRFLLDFEIRVGSTTKTPATLSNVFAQNFDLGAPVVVLPRTQLAFPDFVPGGPTSPADFFVTIPWVNTFAWNAAPGQSFLMQVTVFGNSYGGIAAGYAFDAAGGSSIARLYGSGPAATSGTLERGLGLVLGLRAETHTAVPRLFSTNTPQIGDSFRVRVEQARAAAPALMLLGFSDASWSGLPLPLDLSVLGAPGCALLVSPDLTLPFGTSAGGTGFLVYEVPNDLYLLGLAFYNQAWIAEPSTNALGYALSNGGAAVIGNQ